MCNKVGPCLRKELDLACPDKGYYTNNLTKMKNMKFLIRTKVPILMVLMLFVIVSCKNDVDNPTPENHNIQEAKKDVIVTLEHMGICYGPYHKSGQAPGTAISLQQIETDISIIAVHFDFFRTYTVADNMDQVVGRVLRSYAE